MTHGELIVENACIATTNIRAMGPVENIQPLMLLEGGHYLELPGDDPYYTFKIPSANKNKEKEMVDS